MNAMNTAESSTFWEVPRSRGEDRPCALLFPFAGGWAHSMPEWVDAVGQDRRVLVATYPGRGTRTREPFAKSVLDIADAAFAEYVTLAEPGERPLLIGHSLGAHVAFAVASRLEEHGIEPDALVVAAAAPLPPPAADTPWHELPEEELIEALLELGGVGSEVLQHPQLRQLAMPILRADLRIGYDHLRTARLRTLACPVLAVAGEGDVRTPAAAVAAWSGYTIGRFACLTLPGGHFFQQHAPIDLDAHLGRVKERT